MDWTETGENIGKQDIDKESIVYYKQVHCKKCKYNVQLQGKALYGKDRKNTGSYQNGFL